MVSGSDDGSMKAMGGVVRSVSWCPNNALSLVAVATDTKLFLINTGLGDKLVNARTEELLGEEPDNSGYQPPLRVSQAIKRSNVTGVIINHFKSIKQVRSLIFSHQYQ